MNTKDDIEKMADEYAMGFIQDYTIYSIDSDRHRALRNLFIDFYYNLFHKEWI